MTTPCSAPGCEEPSGQRCSRCKSVRYCSRDCQRRDWSFGHRDNCAFLAQQRASAMRVDLPELGSTVCAVSIFDSQVKDISLSIEELPAPVGGGLEWEPCPVVHILGVPLMIKKAQACGCQVCVGSDSNIPEARHQVATRLAIEPHNGLAPPRWQGGPHNHLGTTIAARSDGQGFMGQDWALLDDYISNNLSDVWGMDPYERDRQLPRVCNSQAYARFLADRSEEAPYADYMG